MVTTDNEIFNRVMDVMLSPEDRRLMLVTPKGAGEGSSAVGCIVFDSDCIALMKRQRDIASARLEAIDTMIMLSELGARLGVTAKEV